MRLMFVLGFLTLIAVESIHLHSVRQHTCEASVTYSYQQFDDLLKLDSLVNVRDHTNLRRALKNELLNYTLQKCGSVIK
jgi:hypothetical protein